MARPRGHVLVVIRPRNDVVKVAQILPATSWIHREGGAMRVVENGQPRGVAVIHVVRQKDDPAVRAGIKPSIVL